MSAFQAERITREQAFRESSATITNDAEYKKAADTYIKDLNKYAAGKRPDGTDVFRNGIGKAGHKEFNQMYSAQFKAQASEHAFGLNRKRNKLNYRIAINSGIKNSSGDMAQSREAIIQSYESMENGGHILPEERIIEQERDIKLMEINYLTEKQATIMLATEEKLRPHRARANSI